MTGAAVQKERVDAREKGRRRDARTARVHRPDREPVDRPDHHDEQQRAGPNLCAHSWRFGTSLDRRAPFDPCVQRVRHDQGPAHERQRGQPAADGERGARAERQRAAHRRRLHPSHGEKEGERGRGGARDVGRRETGVSQNVRIGDEQQRRDGGPSVTDETLRPEPHHQREHDEEDELTVSCAGQRLRVVRARAEDPGAFVVDGRFARGPNPTERTGPARRRFCRAADAGGRTSTRRWSTTAFRRRGALVRRRYR